MIDLLAFTIISGILMAAAYKTFYNGYGATAPIPENYDIVIFDDFTSAGTEDANGDYKSLYFHVSSKEGLAEVQYVPSANGQVGTALIASGFVDSAPNSIRFVSDAGIEWVAVDSYDAQTSFLAYDPMLLVTGKAISFGTFPTGVDESFADFHYDPSISPNWICRVRSNDPVTGFSTAQVITDVPFESEKSTHFRIVGSVGQTDFSINNEVVAVIPSSIAGESVIGWSVRATENTATVQVRVDAISIKLALKTPRQFR